MILAVMIVRIPEVSNMISDSFHDIIDIMIAILGLVAIWYQLKREQDISTAQFIVSLNDTFNENDDITYIYNKLKEVRDGKLDHLTENDGRVMGDYVMFFQVINYLLDQKVIHLEMIDGLFANKFFIFVNNVDVQKYQLKFNVINPHMYDLYIKWYNYRKKNKLRILYPRYQFHKELSNYFIFDESKERYLIELNKDINYGYSDLDSQVDF